MAMCGIPQKKSTMDLTRTLTPTLSGKSQHLVTFVRCTCMHYCFPYRLFQGIRRPGHYYLGRHCCFLYFHGRSYSLSLHVCEFPYIFLSLGTSRTSMESMRLCRHCVFDRWLLL